VQRAVVRAVILLATLGIPPLHAQTASDLAKLAPTARRIAAAARADSGPYQRLGNLVDGFGNRLSGSASLEKAIDWILTEMKRDGFANVRGEPVMVPHWVRGAESATLLAPRETPLHMLGLGGSIGTGAARRAFVCRTRTPQGRRRRQDRAV
jgi:carboxypeptidase Q